jgi:hypothetical protein
MRLLASSLVTCCATLAACSEVCEQLSISECRKDSACAVIGGTPLDAEAMCKLEGASAGCAEKGRTCGAAFTYASDPDGVLWEFSSTCVPDGWRATLDTSEEPLALSGNPYEWPSCSEP